MVDSKKPSLTFMMLTAPKPRAKYDYLRYSCESLENALLKNDKFDITRIVLGLGCQNCSHPTLESVAERWKKVFPNIIIERFNTTIPFGSKEKFDGFLHGISTYPETQSASRHRKYITVGRGFTEMSNIAVKRNESDFYVYTEDDIYFEDFYFDKLYEYIQHYYDVPNCIGKVMTSHFKRFEYKKYMFPTGVSYWGVFGIFLDRNQFRKFTKFQNFIQQKSSDDVYQYFSFTFSYINYRLDFYAVHFGHDDLKKLKKQYKVNTYLDAVKAKTEEIRKWHQGFLEGVEQQL